MRRDLKDLRLLLTGASRGIGRAVAEQAAAAGARVALTARSADRLEELATALRDKGADAIAVLGDITRDEDRHRILERVTERFGGLDVLINNAGVGSFGHFADCSEEILRQVMEVNFFAPAELMRLAIPTLTRGRTPAIVNVSSMCGRRGMPAWPEYSASKFALCGLSEALHGELARFGIDVLLIVPGLTSSELSQNLLRNEGKMRIDFGGGMTPESVAARILQSLVRNRAETVLGREARWMLLMNRFFPRLVDRLVARKVKQLYAAG